MKSLKKSISVRNLQHDIKQTLTFEERQVLDMLFPPLESTDEIGELDEVPSSTIIPTTRESSLCLHICVFIVCTASVFLYPFILSLFSDKMSVIKRHLLTKAISVSCCFLFFVVLFHESKKSLK